MRDAVYIAGAAMHPFGRFPEETLTVLGARALLGALEDAEVSLREIQALFCGTAYGGVGAGHKVLSALGATSVPVVNVEAGCASGVAAMWIGVQALHTGACERVAVLGMEKMPKGMIRSSFFEGWQEKAGLAVTPAYFALRAQRLMQEEDLTENHLAAVVVKNRGHGTGNPNAMFRTPVAEQEVLNSPVVCEPLRLWMLCSPNEGAACVVLQRKPPERRPRVRVEGVALRSHMFGNVLGEHTPLCGLVEGVPASPTELAARQAYEATGVEPREIDVVECQDTDAAREILAWRELGLCAPGECDEAIRQRRFGLGGRTPVNVSGGLLSKGEPLGASAVGQIVELCWQLQGRARGYQVEGCRLALAHTVGRGANAAVTILARES
jgi:acetyl-CoA acetyltransferase